MDDNRRLVVEVWRQIYGVYLGVEVTKVPTGLDVQAIDYIAAYGEARYKAGVEAMRDAVRCEMGCDLDALAARLLEEK